MSTTGKAVVQVTIAGEEYTIRAGATPEYTRACAEYLDAMVNRIVQDGAMVETHRAVILAALALTDELFQARTGLEEMRKELTARAERLTDEIEAAVDSDPLASVR